MFYLLWIDESGDPGRMYGPADYETCQAKMRQFVADDYGADYSFGGEDDWHPNEECVEGWHILQATPF